jgi:protein-S-isoprenylcysteine O-methyltransferase Ste14
MTIYSALIVACWGIFLIVWLVSSFSAKKNIGGVRWMSAGYRGGIVLMVILMVNVATTKHWMEQFARWTRTTPGSIVATVGVVLCALGVAFAIWARVHIGRNWGMPMSVKEHPDLVTSGPYAWVRHPIYSGGLCAAFGSMLAAGPIWGVLFLLSLLYFLPSARVEERRMAQLFPTDYPAYQRRTKMLIPFIV